MEKYVIITKSESGDRYHYLVKTKRPIAELDTDKFLSENGNDIEGGVCYEYVEELFEIKEKEFIII